MELKPRLRVMSPLHFAAGGNDVDNVPVILVVEDDQLVQSIVEASLTEGGFEISIASTGEKAVTLLETSEGKYRALITDINLGQGNLDGWDVARHAREIDPNFPVVYMSGKDADDWASKGVPNSIMLAKPFAPAQFVTAISSFLTPARRSRLPRRRSVMTAPNRRSPFIERDRPVGDLPPTLRSRGRLKPRFPSSRALRSPSLVD